MQKISCLYRISRAFSIAGILFISGSGNVMAYGGYHFGHGYHHYGHHGHYGLSAHYSSHGGIGTAGYVILGLFGAVLLSQLFNRNNYQHHGTYQRSYPVQRPVTNYQPVPPVKQYSPIYHYGSHEGWNALSGGNAGFALDIFAIQSQEDMGNGVPRVGFALAAAANGELDRGARAMRKALSIDPYALNDIQVTDELRLMIDMLAEEYTAALQHKDQDFDYSFMVATLSYLKQDFSTASEVITNADQSQSANNLRQILSLNL